MSPKAIDAEQRRSDLEAPFGRLLIVHSIPDTLCLYLHGSPNHANDRDARAMGSSDDRSGCRSRDCRGSDCISTALLCLRKDVCVVAGVGVQDRHGFGGAPPWIADSKGGSKGVGVDHQVPVLDKGGGSSGGDVFVGEESAEDGNACGACSSGRTSFRYYRRRRREDRFGGIGRARCGGHGRSFAADDACQRTSRCTRSP